MAGNNLKKMQIQRQIQLGPWQQTPDQIDRKRGHEHFLKTRKREPKDEKISDAMASAELLVSEAEDLKLGLSVSVNPNTTPWKSQ